MSSPRKLRQLASASLNLLLFLSSSGWAKPKVIFWWDSHPGFPPRSEWKKDDTPASLAKEMHYANMQARPGSPWHYRRLKALGFDAVGLPGFAGPFGSFDPDSDQPANLNPVKQTRNQRYYIRWARKAGLEVYLNIQYTSGDATDGFLWNEESFGEACQHLLVLARYARRTGCKGLIFDFEPYRPAFHRFWDLSQIRERMGLERTAALELLRQRGVSFAGSIAAEFPECVLHVYGIGCGYFTSSPGDFEDTLACFTAGLCEPRLAGGVHLDMANTYYRYDPRWVGDTYRLEMLPLLEKVVRASRVPDTVRKRCSIALGSAAIHRWHSGDGMYDRAVYRLTPERYAAHLIALLQNCPRYVWIVGEASFDWTIPELGKETGDDPYGFWGLDVPFRDVSERNSKLADTFAGVMRLSDRQIAVRYEQLLKQNERNLEQLREQVPRKNIAYLHNKEAYIEFDNDLEWRIRHVWSLNSYPKLDLARLAMDLPKTDAVISCVSPVWADRADEELIAEPRELPQPEEWRGFLNRGGLLVLADFATNPNASRWLSSIARELSLSARLARCEPNRPAVWWNENEPIVREPNRLRLFTCGLHLDCDEAEMKGWVVLAKCPHGRPIYLTHRFGLGLVAVLMSSKFQAGFGAKHVMNLLKAVQ